MSDTGTTTGTGTDTGTTGTDAAAAAAAAAAAGGTGTEAKSWLESLDPKLRGDRSLSKFESLDALAQAHLNLEKRFGKNPDRVIELPEKPDDKAAWDAIHAKLGRPDTPEAYKTEFAADARDEDKAFVGEFGKVAHAAGLSQAQFKAAVDFYNGAVASAAEANKTATETATAATQAALKAEWGDKYPVYSKEIGALLVKEGGDDLLTEMNAAGLGNSPALAKFLAKMVDKMAESGSLPGGAPNVGGALTPYQATTKIAELEGDPVKGKALMDKGHPMHKAVMEERMALLKVAYPGEAAQAA